MELLVVIAIIGVLAAIAIPAINNARAKARDVRRVQGLKEFSAALELYYENHQQYPAWAAGGSFAEATSTNPLYQALVPAYMPSLPEDPLSSEYVYYYKTDADGWAYKLVAYMEKDKEKAEKDGGSALRYYEAFTHRPEKEQVHFTGNPAEDDSDYLDEQMPGYTPPPPSYTFTATSQADWNAGVYSDTEGVSSPGDVKAILSTITYQANALPHLTYPAYSYEPVDAYGTIGAPTLWTYPYQGEILPQNASPAWSRGSKGTINIEQIESVGNGKVLHLKATGTAPDTGGISYSRGGSASNATGNTIEARIKFVSGGDSTFDENPTIQIFDGTYWVSLVVASNSIQVSGSGSYSMDTTSDYHVYRLTLKETSVKAYVDGVLRLSGTASTGTSLSVFLFGLASTFPSYDYWLDNGETSEAYFDYVYYYSGDALSPCSTGDSPIQEIVSNKLHVVAGISQMRFYRYRLSSEFGGALVYKNFAIEAKLKISSNYISIDFHNGAYRTLFYINTSNISVWGSSGGTPSYSMDTTGDYHVYKIVRVGTNVKVYVDGILRIDTTNTISSSGKYLSFGNEFSSSGSESWWEYIKFYPMGEHTSQILYTDDPYHSFVFTRSTIEPNGTTISFEERHGNQPDLSDGSAYSSITPGNFYSLPENFSYWQIRSIFFNDEITTPTLQDYTLNFPGSP